MPTVGEKPKAGEEKEKPEAEERKSVDGEKQEEEEEDGTKENREEKEQEKGIVFIYIKLSQQVFCGFPYLPFCFSAFHRHTLKQKRKPLS
jgi:hypothetical protein